MRARLLAPALFAVLLTGCNDILGGDDEGRTGFITMPTFDNGAGGFVVHPLVAFYGTSQLVYNMPTAGSCGDFPFNANAPGGTIGGLATLDAGPSVEFSTPLGESTLPAVVEFGIRLYRSENAGGIIINPGDTATVDVPGGPGFPATSISVRTAERLIIDNVGVPNVGEPLPVTWGGVTEPGSVMLLSLRYSTGSVANTLDRQLLCAFTDDGADQIPSQFTDGWISSPGGLRSQSATRIRLREVQIDGKTRVTFVSTFQTPTPSLIP